MHKLLLNKKIISLNNYFNFLFSYIYCVLNSPDFPSLELISETENHFRHLLDHFV
jgi:hypothetical protein